MSRNYSATERAAQTAATVGTEPPEHQETPDFPAECLPPVLEKITRAIAEVCNVPLGMAAPMVLAVASASIGNGVQLRFARGNVTRANLFILMSKVSGSGGSMTYRHAVAPFVGIQKLIRKEFEERDKPRLDAEHADISQQIEAAKRELKDAIGTEREAIIERLTKCNKQLADVEKRQAGKVLFVTDITSEKLAEILEGNGEVMTHFDSDAGDALGTILGTRYGNGKSTNESLWLKGYTGEPTVIFRKNSPPVNLDEPCLGVLFIATPDTVSELYQMERLCTGGLLPRFLSCNPGARRVPLSQADFGAARSLPSDASQPYEAAIFAAVNRYRLANAGEPALINCGEGVNTACIEDDEKACSDPDGESDPFAARQMENAVRIALVLHVFKHIKVEQHGPGTYRATEINGHEQDLSEQTMRDGLRIRDWFTKHQNILREPERVAAEDAAWEKAQDFMRGQPAERGTTARDFYNGHRVCRDVATANKLIELWTKEGRIIAFERKREGAGRPTVAYKLATKARI